MFQSQIAIGYKTYVSGIYFVRLRFEYFSRSVDISYLHINDRSRKREQIQLYAKRRTLRIFGHLVTIGSYVNICSSV